MSAPKSPLQSAIKDSPSDSQHPPIVRSPDGWLPPGGYDGCTEWALDNREALEEYARENQEEGTAAEQLQRFLAEHPELTADRNGKV